MNQWTARATLGRFPSGILGTEGTLLFTGDPQAPLTLCRPGCPDEAIPVPNGPEGFGPCAEACVEHYVACLATGAEPYAGLDLARLTLEAITAAYEGAREGRRMPLTSRFRTRFPA